MQRLHMECVSHRQRSDKTYHSDHVLGHIAQHPSDVRSHLAHCSTIIYETQVVVGSISDFTPPRQYYPRICCTQLGGLTTVLLDVGLCVRASETRRFTGDIPRVLFRNLRSECVRSTCSSCVEETYPAEIAAETAVDCRFLLCS